MGLDTMVVGFKPPNEKWKRMRDIWVACDKINVAVPDEVVFFFNGDKPSNAGVRVDLIEHGCATKQGRDGDITVDIQQLPKDIKTIRFWTSY